ncbi:MAG: dockerin type I repeat-containing protein [Methanomassiliicoccaceae archaeon]|nr:dockerin type I repeat-containing protein [Methanomassiliicoccaceae archaeon]
MLGTSKAIAIAVVAVVVVAGAGVALFALGGGKDRISIDAVLEVYGNANGDGRIDQADIDLVREIIAGAKSFEDHPLADANYDGVVDEKDIQQIERIISASSADGVRVYHINNYNGEKIVVDTLYPITSAIGTGMSNTLLVFKYLGIVGEFKGFSWNSVPDSVLFSEYMYLFTESKRLSPSAFNIDIDKASNLVDSDNITAVITDNGVNSLLNEEALLEGAGIDVVRIQHASVYSDEYASAITMVAFLFDTDGKGYMDKCADLIEWYEDFLTDLDNRLDGVRGSVSAVASSMNRYVSTARSDYANVLRMAGASFPLTDIESASGTVFGYDGASDTWLNAYDVDYIVCISTSTDAFSWYGGTVVSSGAATLKAHMGNFRTLECFEKGNVYAISGDMPVMLRIAYAAQIFYGGDFGPDYAYNLHVDFVKRFFGWDEGMVKGKPFSVSMGDLGVS